MNYVSTRNPKIRASDLQAVINGLAPDGGLYVQPDIPQNDKNIKCILTMDTISMAASVMKTFLPSFSEEELTALASRSFKGKFDNDDIAPAVTVGEDSVLELYHGPTSAFKDVALSVLPNLITASKEKLGVKEKVLILTATSGDTGKAALEGFKNVPGCGIIVFYPENGVSDVQKAQMVTQDGGNVAVCAVKGNFDDAQRGVKSIFSDNAFCNSLKNKGVLLSSANSINIGRLAPQVVYYYKCYADLVKNSKIRYGEKVDFCVPCGNFGNILAGFLALKTGLPVGKLICASNANNVLTDFLNTGVYDKNRELIKTASPSMDILVSSNLERMLYYAEDDKDKVAFYMRKLNEEGKYTVSQNTLCRLREIFSCGYCSDEDAIKNIGEVYHEHSYLLDTHTSVAWRVAQEYKKSAPSHNRVVILSTASPFKFPKAVLQGLGEECAGNGFELIERLSEKTGVSVPENLASLSKRDIIFKDVICADGMKEYVFNHIG
ncbi:MAG: threonine synthase [Clostridia bacterium]|nr:threonine synthase [Clostridia bacterium]